MFLLVIFTADALRYFIFTSLLPCMSALVCLYIDLSRLAERHKWTFYRSVIHISPKAVPIDLCPYTRTILNPFSKQALVLCVCSRDLLKTLWEKEKLLVTSNFSFSRSVFYPVWRTFSHFYQFKMVVFKLFHFKRVSNSLFGKGLKILLILFSRFFF